MLGMRFATADIKSLFVNGGIYVSIFIKLILMPLLAYIIMLPFNIDEIIKAVIIITLSMPCASIVLMFSEVYNCDYYSASNSILLSTLLSVLTIPLILLLL
jgi:predicted permease